MSKLKGFVARINSLKEEQGKLGEQVRLVYAEASRAGYDKTALGQVVTILRMRAGENYAEISDKVREYLDEIGVNAPAELGLPRACARESIYGDKNPPLTIKERARALVNGSAA